MKKFTIVALSITLLIGCDISKNTYPLYIINGYFKEPVFHNIEMDVIDSEKEKQFNQEMFGFEFYNKNAPKGVSMYDLNDGGFNVIYVSKIDFFQDEYRQCFLFSYNNETLKNKAIQIDDKSSGRNVIFILNKDKLSAMSRKEYERIKPTLKPHPYDPSLCKPKPSDLK